MKTLANILILAALLIGSVSLKAQRGSDNYLGLPGDNLNLFAVMNLFQESETLEAFERSLNDPETIVNNLDLNGNNLVDYIMVFDYVDGDVHSIVLRVALDKNEYQDVAVFTVEKLRNGSIQVQLIGDEALYGPNYIIEPAYAETPNPGYKGNSSHQSVATTTYYEVSNWPVIVYIYRPTYTVWRSSWYWGYYPSYWDPWTPHYWHYYHGYHSNYHNHYYTYYRPSKIYRSNHYHNVYYGRVRNHSNIVVVNTNNGRYRDTYSRPERRSDGELRYAEKQQRRDQNMSNDRTRNDNRVNPNGRRPTNENNRQDIKTATRPRPETTEGRGSNQRREADVKTGRTTRESNVNSNPPVRREPQAKPEGRTNPSTRESTTTSREKPSTGNSNPPVRREPQVKPEERTSPSTRETTTTSRERPSTPATTTSRPATNQEKPAVREKPSTPKKESETSVRENNSSSESKSKSERTERKR
jgi:hypothetical protein